MPTITRFIMLALINCGLGATAPRAVSGIQDAKQVQTRMVERRVHINPPDANDSRYAYVPFDVPQNAVRVSVSYQYDRVQGANTIDLGIFDARSTGADTDPRGFRGWSGGRRSEFFITHDEATPGYLPGDMSAGTWRIILGLYKIAPEGVDVSFNIVIATEEINSISHTKALRNAGQSSVNSIAAPPMRATPRRVHWWSGDLHMHTVHSDGDWTIAELISKALNNGLDFICITDHNTASHHAEIDRARTGLQPLILRGEEITTYNGHANAWGLPSGAWIDFRVRAGDSARMSNLAAEAHRAGALISINHPYAPCGGCAWSYDAAAQGFDGIEVWNGIWDTTDEQALVMWDKILQSGRHITAIASSDSHRPANPIGQPTTHLAANALSQAALLDAIRQGRAYLTSEVTQPVVSFEAEAALGKRRLRRMIGDEMRLNAPARVKFFLTTADAPLDSMMSLISNGTIIRRLNNAPDGRQQVLEIECRRDSYFRLEVRDKTGTMLALTNPIYVKIGKGR